MNFILQKSDNLGVMASALCMLHCLATPFIFIAQTCSTSCCELAPEWWGWVDYFFLFISFFAVYRSTQNTTNTYMKPALWLSWGALFMTIANERVGWFPMSEAFIYAPAMVLVALHLYNLKYCQCKTDKSCTYHE